MTKVIGLAGGIGSGKSTISRYLTELGAVLIDADKAGHEVFTDTEAWRELVVAFGQEILTPGGEIDRKKLGEVVFGNAESLSRLNKIIRPRMIALMKARIEEYRRQGANMVVVDCVMPAPPEVIRTEGRWTPQVDEVWVIAVSKATVIKRLKEQRGLEEEQAVARMSSQLSDEERVKYADAVINNDGDLDEVRAKVKELWKRLEVV
ncbi:MAG: dephospho-CoA kinase [Dehalococcoidales bacterium]|nr:dephospho-CoA kinase [Dehalococcoidales bacterium]